MVYKSALTLQREEYDWTFPWNNVFFCLNLMDVWWDTAKQCITQLGLIWAFCKGSYFRFDIHPHLLRIQKHTDKFLFATSRIISCQITRTVLSVHNETRYRVGKIKFASLTVVVLNKKYVFYAWSFD